MSHADERPEDTEIEDVLDELEELEDIVDTDEEREQVRETMRKARRAHRPRVFGRVQNRFDIRDVGEAVVGSFIFGIAMIVEDGTLAVGRHISNSPLYMAITILFGLAVVLGILHAARFDEIEADMLLGFIPIRLLSILAIATTLAFGLMTIWGRVDWSEPRVAAGQCIVTAIVMAVGASLGDVLPE